MSAIIQPVFDRPSRKDLLKELAQSQALHRECLHTLAALLVEANGSIRIPMSTFTILDGSMVIKQDQDGDTMVLSLLTPDTKADA